MRAAVFGLLTNDAELNAYGFDQANVWESNSVDAVKGTARQKMFISTNVSDTTKAFAGHGSQDLTVWVHQPVELGRDYAMIDMAILRIKEIMAEAVHVEGADGWTLTGASWSGDSGDLFDDGFNTVARNTTFRVASRYVGTVLIR